MTTRNPLVRLVTLAALCMATAICIPAGASASNSCSSEQICAPSIALDKLGPAWVAQGEPATYTFSVYNNGDQDMVNVNVSDDLCSNMTGPTGDNDDGVLSPYETWTYSCTYTPAGQPGDAVTDTGTATAQYGKGSTFETTDQATTTIVGLDVTKTVDAATADPYDTLTYTITIKHDGPDWVNLNGRIFDYGCDNPQSSDENADGSYWNLSPGESVTYTCTHVYDPTVDTSSYTNAACAMANVYNRELAAFAPAGEQGEYAIQKCASATTTLAKHNVTGQVFEDLNADGTRQAGEPGMAGVVVYGDLNGNGARDEGEPSSTTDGQGNYSLDVPLGKTAILQEGPGGTTCSFPAGCGYTADLPKNAAPQVFTRAVDPTGFDFGNWRPASASGTVVSDSNGNGVNDHEPGLAGVVVYADLNGNGSLDAGEPSYTSGADGGWGIGGLKPGAYVIREVTPADRSCTAPVACNHNIALSSGGAANGREFLNAAPPGQLVLPARIVPGSARLSGRNGCVASGFFARVRGTKIAKVVFTLDGRRVKTLTKGTFQYRVSPSRLAIGKHRLVATVTFATSSGTRPKTLHLSFQRCAAQLRAPQFTG